MLQPQTNGFEAAYTQARVYLMQNPNWVFFSALLMLLEDRIDTEGVPTCEVDGKHLDINSEFFMSIPTKAQRATLLAHESMHIALKHMLRMETLTEEEWARWNDACDYVINLLLKEAGFEPIEGWLYDEQYKDMSTEQVYKLLQDKEKPDDEPTGGSLGADVGQPGKDDGSGGGNGDQPGHDQQQAMAQLSGEIDVMLRQAEQQTIAAGAKPGAIPGQVQAYLDSLMKPILPTKKILRRFMQDLSKDDYSWRRINRRFHPMILPGLHSEGKLMHIAFWFDMSGSVSKHDYTRYMSEVLGVMRGMKPDKLTIGQFDVDIKSVDVIKNIRDLMKVELRGRGGTDIECVMEWAKKNKPAALVVFSDGEYEHPSFNPGCPVLWLIHGRSQNRFKCDFGTIVRFDT